MVPPTTPAQGKMKIIMLLVKYKEERLMKNCKMRMVFLLAPANLVGSLFGVHPDYPAYFMKNTGQHEIIYLISI